MSLIGQKYSGDSGCLVTIIIPVNDIYHVGQMRVGIFLGSR